jgi:hypothetical protein
MSQCAGRTQKGDQCKREAREGSTYCSIHQDQGARPRAAPEREAATAAEDPDWMLKAALGFAAIAVIVLFRIRR